MSQRFGLVLLLLGLFITTWDIIRYGEGRVEALWIMLVGALIYVILPSLEKE